MATITVDDREIEVPDRIPLLQALLDAGIFIPHFCYHQDLPVDGNCRQCLVEMDTPKGAAGTTSCTTQVMDGMIVRTNTDSIEKARRGVLEYLLVNHPVDCPVCDQAGECRLQMYYMDYGFHETRVNIDKVNKGKTEAIGDRVILDQERCVLCRRCVRFTDHVTKTSDLAIGGRGDHSFITTFPGLPFNNKYTVNTVDICPVGALTDLDFRFKCRVWYLKQTDTVCPGCARGCNAQIETYNHNTMDELNDTAYRIRPRRNPFVNKSWMCDEGRLLYRQVNDERIQAPLLGSDQEESAWEQAFDSVTEKIKNAEGAVAGVCSPDCTNEEIYLFRKFMKEVVGGAQLSAESRKELGYQDNILLRADKHPNTLGAKFQGPWNSLDNILVAIDSGEVKVLVVMRNDFLGLAEDAAPVRETLSKLDLLVVIDSNTTATTQAADVVLPSGSFAEREGTFVNFHGRIQRIFRAYLPRWDSKSEIEILRTLAEKLGKPLEGLSNAIGIWKEMSGEIEEFKGIEVKDIGRTGAMAAGYEEEEVSIPDES